ncbi:TetR/AcrR family transcriptional regulator [Paracoccus sanguinis]|uniref:TetR/AcrR family transcriptional regulator n=1 Tax=Paracoccus sanguinis TaxID=1545044 RepID=UPI0006975652|nr:TetR/AcrR family transcriptional regulator [Paracoccus sanguinis]
MTQLPQRRSRAQMQEETRSRLIEAANDIIAEGGVAAASIRGVCERAGFSQGAFYSNFTDKEELLLALLEQQMHAAIREIEDLMARMVGGSLDEDLSLLAARLQELGDQPVPARLTIELYLHARRDPNFAAHLDRLRAAYHTDFARLLDGLAARHGVKWQVPPLHLSQMLHTLWTGYVVQSPNDRPSLADALNIICHATIDFPQDD